MILPANSSVHIWRFELDREDAPLEHLAADEHARAARFQFAPDARRWITGRSLLRRTLGECLKCDPHTLQFETGPWGKPRLKSSPLRFNLSHSGGLLLLALAWDQEVGVDIEHLRHDFVPEDLAAPVCSPQEQTALRQTAPAERHAAFLALWTAKEAYVKARGMGLSFPLPQLTLTLAESTGEYEVKDSSQSSTGPGISVCRLDAGPGFVASLAVEGGLPDSRVQSPWQ